MIIHDGSHLLILMYKWVVIRTDRGKMSVTDEFLHHVEPTK